METFVLPHILPGFSASSSCFYYPYQSDATTNKSKIHFTRYCCSIVLNGIKHLRSAGGVQSFTGGTVLLFSPGNYMSYEIVETGSGPYSSVLLFFDRDFIRQFFSQVSQPTQSTVVNDDRPYLSREADEYLLHYSVSLKKLLMGSGFSKHMQEVKLMELLTYLFERNPAVVYRLLRHGHLPDADANLMTAVENNLHSDLTIEELAFLCNTSLSTFKRRFEMLYHESPGRWIKRQRLDYAAEQIKSGRKTPSEVYCEVGYADYSSFSYSFKQQFGLCPKEYRQHALS